MIGFHVLVCYGEVFITVLFKYGAIGVERSTYVDMTDDLLQYLWRHTGFCASCSKCMTQAVQIHLAENTIINDMIVLHNL